MPGQNIIGKCAARHDSDKFAILAIFGAVTLSYAKNSTSVPDDPDSPTVSVSQTADFSGDDTVEYRQAEYRAAPPGVGKFHLTRGCCCPCRWVLRGQNEFPEVHPTLDFFPDGPALHSFMERRVVTTDGVASETENEFFQGAIPDPVGLATTTRKCNRTEDIESATGQTVMSVGIPVPTMNREIFSEDSPDWAIEVAGADATFGSFGMPTGLSVEIDPCNPQGQYAIQVSGHVEDSYEHYDLDSETTITESYTGNFTVDLIIVLAPGDPLNDGASGTSLQGGNLQTNSLQTGSLQTGGLRTGELSTGNLTTGTLNTGRLSSPSIQTNTLDTGGGLSLGGLHTSSLN